MLSGFRSFDIFPNKVQLNIKSSHKYQTSAGTILTFVLVAIILIETVTTLNGIFNHESPVINDGRSYNTDPGSLGLNASNFVFAVKVNDPLYDLSQSYISYQLSIQSVIRDPNGSISLFQQIIPLKQCDLEYMKGFEADYVSLGLETALCPSVYDYDVVGTYLNDNYTFININVFPCQNDTSQPDIICQPIEQVQQLLGITPLGNSLEIQFFFSNTLFTPSNHTTPVTRFIDQTYWDVNPGGSTLEGDLFVDQQIIISDDFVWLSGYNVKNLSTFNIDLSETHTNYKRLQMTGPAPNNYSILTIIVQRSNYVYTTNRTYATVYSGLSTIGGLLSLVVGIFGAIAAIYTRREYLVTVANEMYDFELPDHLDRNKSTKSRFCCCLRRKKKKVPQGSEETSSPKAFNKDKKEAGYSEMLHGKLSSFYAKKGTKEKSKLDYGFLDFLLGIFCCGRREKDRFIRRALETITKDTDILHLIKGVQENERLKKVLLSQEQQDLFEHACSPVIVTSDLWKSNKSKSTQAPSRSGIINRRETMIEETKDPGDPSKPNPKSIIDSKRSKEQPSEKDDPHKQFISLCGSYQKIFKDYSNPVNYKLIELLDPTLHEALYDMSQVIKETPTIDCKQDIRRGHDTVLLVKRGSMHNKLEAAVKIAKRLQSKFRERKNSSRKNTGGIDLQEIKVHQNNDDTNENVFTPTTKNTFTPTTKNTYTPTAENLRIQVLKQNQNHSLDSEDVSYHADISPNRPYLSKDRTPIDYSPSDSFQNSPLK